MLVRRHSNPADGQTDAGKKGLNGGEWVLLHEQRSLRRHSNPYDVNDQTGSYRQVERLKSLRLRSIGRFCVEVADEIGQIGVTQLLTNCHELADVIPVMVDDAQEQ